MRALTKKQKQRLSQLTGQARQRALQQYQQQRLQPQLVSMRRAPPPQPPRGASRRLNAVQGTPAQRRPSYSAAMAQAALVKGLGRLKLSSSDMFRGGALSNAQFAPRGHGYYDAFSNPPNAVVLASAVGPVTPMVGHARMPIHGSEGHIATGAVNAAGQPSSYADNRLTSAGVSITLPMPATNSRMFVFNVGSSDDEVGFVMYPTVEGTMFVDKMRCSALAGFANPGQLNWISADMNGGDTGVHSSVAQDVETIPLRGSLRIVNTTEERFQGGMVRTLRYNGGLLFGHDVTNSTSVVVEPTVDSYFKLRDLIRDSARSEHYSGKDFSKAKQFNLHPADFIRSHTFSSDKTLYEAILTPRFNTLLVLIDDFTASGTTHNNSYEVNVLVQRAGRFAPGTLHHNNAKEMPTDSAMLAKLTDLESKLASLGRTV